MSNPSTHGRRASSVRKTPKQVRGFQTVRSIIKTAKSQILDDGFENVTVSNIAKKAGVNIASFYKYFPNRAALFQQIVEEHQQAIQVIIEKELRVAMQTGDVIQLSDNLIDQMYVYYKRNPDFHACWHAVQGDPALKAIDIDDTMKAAHKFAAAIEASSSRKSNKDLVAYGVYLVLSSSSTFRFACIQPHVEAEALVDSVKQVNRLLLSELTK